MDPAIPRPNAAAATLLASRAFQQQALHGAECAGLANQLEEAAGGAVGGVLQMTAADVIELPSVLGPGSAKYHVVYTDGNFVFDPIYSADPIPRTEYEVLIQSLNGNQANIDFWPAQP